MFRANVPRMPWRTVVGEERRCGTQHVWRPVDRTGDEFTTLDLVHTYGNVNATFDEAVDLVGQIGDDPQIGVLGCEVGPA